MSALQNASNNFAKRVAPDLHFQGQTLPGPVIVDVAGLSLSEAERKRLQHPLVGGVILFARNFTTREQLIELCQSIREVRAGPLLIAVDHEGGRVQRFRDDGFTHIAPMAALGEYWDQDPQLAVRAASDVGFVLASELRACGIDLSFTPVLDLNWGMSGVIGDRALHRDPAAVTALARGLIHGLLLAGMAACGKHFPGHGAVAEDSHLAIPYDSRPKDEILGADAAPYRWLGDLTLAAIMPAHVIYSQVDVHPAGFSSIWLHNILREELAYDGLVFSDDLTMEAASVAGDIVARAQAALDAGCDMALVCNRPDLADQVLAGLTRSNSAGLQRRLRRLLPGRQAPAWDTLQADSTYHHARRRLRSIGLSG